MKTKDNKSKVDDLKDFGLPISATVLFIVLVVTLFLGLAFDRLSLADILRGNTSAGSYAQLLSGDRVADLNRHDVANSSGDSLKSTFSKNFSFKSDVDSSLTISQDTETTQGATPPAPAGTTNGTGGTVSTGSTPPPPPFSATAENLIIETISAIDCSSGACVKHYTMRADVRAYNGPGTVEYSWLGEDLTNDITGSQDGSVAVGAGDTFTPVHGVFDFDCAQPLTFTGQFRINKPTASLSNKIQSTHSC